MTILGPPNAVISYDDADFKGIFPEFVNCTSQQGQNWFNQASALCDNSPSSRLILQGGNYLLQQALYYLTAHIGYLDAPRDPNGNPTGQQGSSAAPQVVGRISSASQGSVSVSTDMPTGGGSYSQAYYMQTKYGARYWELTKTLRTFQYFATPTRVPGPRPFFGRRW